MTQINTCIANKQRYDKHKDRKRRSLRHHDRLMLCNDTSFQMWLRRKERQLVQSLPTDENLDQEDNFSIAGPFDPNHTLPQILENDPDVTLSYMLGMT